MGKDLKKILVILLALIMVLSVATGCGKKDAAEQKVMSYEDALKEARGTTVTFYGWGGDEKLNSWIDHVFAKKLKDEYDITLKRIPMDIDDILSQLTGEKQAGSDKGTIDMIWINGENFYSAKENGLLYGPFTSALPNMEKYVDMGDPETEKDFCVPTEGYEAPYSKAQLVMMADTAQTGTLPENTEEFKAFCMANKGKVTYPALPDFTGSAFVRNVIYDICGYEQFMDMDADKEALREEIRPAMDYLKELNPYLWKEGKTFPESSDKLGSMFQSGEVVFNISYNAFAVGEGIGDGIYPDTVKAFLFKKGTIGNTNYIAIAANAPNKAGAIVAINEMLSAEMQATKYADTFYIPVTDYKKLTDSEKEQFDKVDTGKGNVSQETLLDHRLPEMPAKLVPLIEEIWLEEVVGK